MRVDSHRVDFTATEYRVIEQLLLRPETVVSREQLAERVWGGDQEPSSNAIDVYIGYVRRKLQAHHPAPLIHTLRGIGYMLKA